MRIHFETIYNNLVIKLNGELDHHTAEEIRDEIDKEIDNNNVKNIIFDLEDMHFMDSSGIGVVIGRYKKVQKLGGQAAVINMNNRVERIFKMSGLFNIVKKFENKKEALERL
ncbi:anti-sigma F factor antagonist [Crassaminicella thermophila]|uniref:Anti-sigma F factor antagonist n=1 Tax=Crassaminicella thermophila TaxID=2599308 RepID=A0A5C0SE79_CRATE|nr:anti-sigma F factor antagonist [Crassaminicella thermophila]QEK12460.1 anti-sigma F factor antagonist [Crassaminicella thermophila]